MTDLALARYDSFYEAMEELLAGMAERWGRFAVYDLHGYNHRRRGRRAPPDDPREAPEINVGTGGLDRERWGPVVDRFVEDLARFPYLGRSLDVRENVRFQGGHFPRWIARRFPEHACPLAIEVKKVYVDEWTGEIRPWVVEEIRRALASTLPGVTRALDELGEVAPRREIGAGRAERPGRRDGRGGEAPA